MARPTHKIELQEFAEEQYQKLWNLIETMTEEEQESSFIFEIQKEKEAHWKRDKNTRDVLVHLYEWHQLLLNFVSRNQRNENVPFLPEPYNWKTYGEMNVEMIWKKHQDTSYTKAKELFRKSHAEVMDLLGTFSDEELFQKKYFPWTGTTHLGSYFISVTSSHYDWAMKKIKKQIKALKEKKK